MPTATPIKVIVKLWEIAACHPDRICHPVGGGWRCLRDCYKSGNLKSRHLLTFKPLENLFWSGTGQRSHLGWTVQRSDCQDPLRILGGLHVCTRMWCHGIMHRRGTSHSSALGTPHALEVYVVLMAGAQLYAHSFQHCIFCCSLVQACDKAGTANQEASPPTPRFRAFPSEGPAASVAATVTIWLAVAANEEILPGVDSTKHMRHWQQFREAGRAHPTITRLRIGAAIPLPELNAIRLLLIS